jgi:hypothetical protein
MILRLWYAVMHAAQMWPHLYMAGLFWLSAVEPLACW